jgi:hypothetical protein
MHEEMHERTGQQKEVRQNAKEMGAVFAEEQDDRDREETKTNEKRTGTQEASGLLMVVPIMLRVIVCHRTFPVFSMPPEMRFHHLGSSTPQRRQAVTRLWGEGDAADQLLASVEIEELP